FGASEFLCMGRKMILSFEDGESIENSLFIVELRVTEHVPHIISDLSASPYMEISASLNLSNCTVEQLSHFCDCLSTLHSAPNDPDLKIRRTKNCEYGRPGLISILSHANTTGKSPTSGSLNKNLTEILFTSDS